MGWTGFGCKSVWRDLSKLAVTYFCRRLSVGIEEGWRSASTCETSPPLDPLPYTISLHPPPPPCYSLHPSTSPICISPTQLSLDRSSCLFLPPQHKKVRKVLSKFVANFQPLLVISCSKFLHGSVLSSTMTDWWTTRRETEQATVLGVWKLTSSASLLYSLDQ